MSVKRINIGKQGEDLACTYLKQHGYDILCRNYRKRVGEIDIIGMDGNYLVFIEVKTRNSNLNGSPLEAVTLHKQRQIIKVAEHYLAENNSFDMNIRFDVLGILLSPSHKPSFDLIKSAFEVC